MPGKGREKVLEMLHQAQLGISKMKSLARCYVWWPGMDRALEACVKTCEPCPLNRKKPPVIPLHSWAYPNKPWSRVHRSRVHRSRRSVHGETFLLIIDA